MVFERDKTGECMGVTQLLESQHDLSSSTTTSFEQTVLQMLQEVLPSPRPIVLHEPELTAIESSTIQDCLDSTFVSSVGKYVDQFERMLTEYTGAQHAVVVVNGTAALQVALKLAGVKAHDEVLVPTLSFVATANAVAHCQAIPHFVDSDCDTLGMDPVALANYLGDIVDIRSGATINRLTGRRISAIVPMHAYGHPVNMNHLMVLADRYRLPVVEDAAESLGSTYHGRHTGTLGKLGILSFNGNKIITTGGGGAILTNDSELARQAKHLTTTAKRNHGWEFFHDEVAWNYRLPNLNAALGCAQMNRLADILERKRKLAHRYEKACSSIRELRFMSEPANTRSNYWLNTICLQRPDMEVRDQLLASLNANGYQCRPIWTLLHKLPMYIDCPRSELSVAERLEACLINLPSSARLAV